ncbi:MAG: hypothetical protein WCF84_14420 [Anaerolineae bacterium]
MNSLNLLAKLQTLDTRIQETFQARGKLEARMADKTAVTAAQESVTATARQEHDLRARLHNLELEVKGLEEQIRGVDLRLYGGKVTNAKELSGLTRDEEMLKRQKGELEDQMLELMAQIEAVQAQASTQRDALAKITAMRGKEDEQDTAKLAVLQATAAQLNQEREHLRSQIAAPDLSTYDSLSQSKKGSAVAHIKGASCAVCGYAIPSGIASRARIGDELMFCVNCGRILVS